MRSGGLYSTIKKHVVGADNHPTKDMYEVFKRLFPHARITGNNRQSIIDFFIFHLCNRVKDGGLSFNGF